MTRATLVAATLLASCSARGSPSQCHAVLPRGDARAVPPAAAPRLGEAMGVQVQSWYLQPGDLDRIAAAGFGTVRWGIPWDMVERAPGSYDWQEADRFVAALARSHLRSVVILGYGNHLYAGPDGAPTPPRTGQRVEARPPVAPAARRAFARFAAAAASRYRDQPVTWEIWNEPDNATFWEPRPAPAMYAALAADACRAMRAAAPRATIIGGVGAALPNAVAHRDNVYAALRQAGAFACLDGVSGHAYRMSRGYRQPDPESVVPDYAASRDYVFADLGLPSSKKLLVTEWGFTTGVIDPDLQAAYLLRANLTNASIGVPLTIWYEWRDSRAGADDPEAHFGILTTTGGQKGRRDTLALLSRLAPATVVSTLASDCEDARILLLRRGEERFAVGWMRASADAGPTRLYLDGVGVGEIGFMPSILPVPPRDRR